MRAMYAAVSGLDTEQTAMDTIGNNIANVTTPGFKQGSTEFSQMFAQTLRGAAAPTATLGGTNPAQVGLGVQLAGVRQDMSQGSIESTGVATDMAISGNGMFILSSGGTGGSGGSGGQTVYTRLGQFSQDANGTLVSSQGLKVQGWMATNGTFGPENAATMTSITIPSGSTQPPTPTANIVYGGNLDATTPSTSSVSVPVQVYDSLGNTTAVTVTFTPSGANNWTWTATIPSPTTTTGTTTTTPPPTTVGTGTVAFTSSGAYSSGSGTISFTPTGANALTITPNFQQMTQYAQTSNASAVSQDGSAAGSLQGFTIDQNGVITGQYSNGLSQAVGQVALATFANPGGLLQVGNSNYAQSNNSGLPAVSTANTGGAGSIAPDSLEQSNVDLARQFTDMITTQRAFQANAQVITTADQMLQVLATLTQAG